MDKFTKLMQLLAITLAPVVVLMELTQSPPNFLKAGFFAIVGLVNVLFYVNER